MQNTRFIRAKSAVVALGAALGLFFLTGCNLGITNLTPSVLPENPSQIYTISTRVKPKSVNIVPGSLTVRIIVDAQSFEMRKAALGADIYEFDYQLPAGRTELAYYFLVNYKFENQGVIVPREEFTDVIRSKIVGRYVLSLETNRGPVGARVSVLGRGFTAQDTVTFDGTPARSSPAKPTRGPPANTHPPSDKNTTTHARANPPPATSPRFSFSRAPTSPAPDGPSARN